MGNIPVKFIFIDFSGAEPAIIPSHSKTEICSLEIDPDVRLGDFQTYINSIQQLPPPSFLVDKIDFTYAGRALAYNNEPILAQINQIKKDSPVIDNEAQLEVKFICSEQPIQNRQDLSITDQHHDESTSFTEPADDLILVNANASARRFPVRSYINFGIGFTLGCTFEYFRRAETYNESPVANDGGVNYSLINSSVLAGMVWGTGSYICSSLASSRR